MSAWRDISTAPKDGTWIIVAGPSGYTSTPLRCEVCQFVAGYAAPWRNHANDAFEDGGDEPTLWTPLPDTDPCFNAAEQGRPTVLPGPTVDPEFGRMENDDDMTGA